MTWLAATLRRSLPTPARRALRSVANYAHRVAIWQTILREIRGVDPAARRTLKRSALAAPVTGWGDAYRWRDPVLLRDAKVEVEGVGRFSLRARTDELFIVLPSREPAVFAALARRLGPGDVFVDAGANIGVFSVFASRLVGPHGRVVSVEMMPGTAARLRHHLALNDCANVEVVQAALDSVAGGEVTAALQPGHAGRATLALAELLDRPRVVTIGTRTLSDVLAPFERVALMKMDIEGAELRALDGAGDALAKVDAIVFEQLDDSGAIAERLRASGYRVELLDRHNYLAVR
jgi:FkbM family methyltransferase